MCVSLQSHHTHTHTENQTFIRSWHLPLHNWYRLVTRPSCHHTHTRHTHTLLVLSALTQVGAAHLTSDLILSHDLMSGVTNHSVRSVTAQLYTMHQRLMRSSPLKVYMCVCESFFFGGGGGMNFDISKKDSQLLVRQLVSWNWVCLCVLCLCCVCSDHEGTCGINVLHFSHGGTIWSKCVYSRSEPHPHTYPFP